MICLEYVKKYCKDYELIENYEEALNSSEKYACHHRMEEVFSKADLIRAGWYYDRKPQELIFLRESEHSGNPSIHIDIRRGYSERKGKPTWNKGRKMSAEFSRKLSEAKKGKSHLHSEEHKRKLSEASKARSEAYKEYKSNGGVLSWNDFQKQYRRY